MLEEVKILEQVEKLSLNPTIIQVLSSTLRLQQKIYKIKNMKHYEHKISHLQLLIFKSKNSVFIPNVSFFYSCNYSVELSGDLIGLER